MVRRLLICTSLLLAIAAGGTQVERSDYQVAGDAGIRLFVREVSAKSTASHSFPLLLIHGARVPGIASFDLPVPGGSLAADFAQRGFHVYLMDIRGYGASTRPKEMDAPPTAHPPLVRSNDAAHDIGTVVDWVLKRQRVSTVALFGSATGGQWAGYYASINPEKVSHLIMLNSLYGGSSQHPLLGHGSDMEDQQHRGRFNQAICGAYRLSAADSLLGAWDRSIPEGHKDEWRDPLVAKAYVESALASDPTSNSRTPPSFPLAVWGRGGQLLPGDWTPAVGCVLHHYANPRIGIGAGFLVSASRPGGAF